MKQICDLRAFRLYFRKRGGSRSGGRIEKPQINSFSISFVRPSSCLSICLRAPFCRPLLPPRSRSAPPSRREAFYTVLAAIFLLQKGLVEGGRRKSEMHCISSYRHKHQMVFVPVPSEKISLPEFFLLCGIFPLRHSRQRSMRQFLPSKSQTSLITTSTIGFLLVILKSSFDSSAVAMLFSSI